MKRAFAMKIMEAENALIEAAYMEDARGNEEFAAARKALADYRTKALPPYPNKGPYEDDGGSK